MEKEKELDIYHNPFKVLLVSYKNLLPSYLVGIDLFLIILISILWYFSLINWNGLELTSFMGTSISSLAFTLSLLSVNMSLLNKHVYKLSNSQIYEFIAPYILTASLFLMGVFLSIFGIIIDVEKVPYNIMDICKFIYIIILIFGVSSLFNLIITIICDFYHSAKFEASIKEKER